MQLRITLGTNDSRLHYSCLVKCKRKLFRISSAPSAEFSDEQVRNVVTRSRAMDLFVEAIAAVRGGPTVGIAIATATAVAKIRIKQFLAIPLAG